MNKCQFILTRNTKKKKKGDTCDLPTKGEYCTNHSKLVERNLQKLLKRESYEHQSIFQVLPSDIIKIIFDYSKASNLLRIVCKWFKRLIIGLNIKIESGWQGALQMNSLKLFMFLYNRRAPIEYHLSKDNIILANYHQGNKKKFIKWEFLKDPREDLLDVIDDHHYYILSIFLICIRNKKWNHADVALSYLHKYDCINIIAAHIRVRTIKKNNKTIILEYISQTNILNEYEKTIFIDNFTYLPSY